MIWGENVACQCTMKVRGKKLCGVGLSFRLSVGPRDQHQVTRLVWHRTSAFSCWTILRVDLSLKREGWCRGGSSHHCAQKICESMSTGAHSCRMLDGLNLGLQSLHTRKCVPYPGFPEAGTAMAPQWAGLLTDVHSCAPHRWQEKEGLELRMRGGMGLLGLEGAKGGNSWNVGFFRSIACESPKIQFRFHTSVNPLHDGRAPALWKLLCLPRYL